jgi:putative FmdB family regulatory protein
MPLYVYRADDPEKACASCRDDFEVLQAMSAAKLQVCPECGTKVTKQFTTANGAFPDGPAALRNLGFARLEKRSDGNYENVSAQPGDERVGPLASFAESLKKGKKPILSD